MKNQAALTPTRAVYQEVSNDGVRWRKRAPTEAFDHRCHYRITVDHRPHTPAARVWPKF